MKTAHIVTILCLSFFTLHSQSLDWIFNVGVVNQECEAQALVEDADGNIYIAGYFASTMADFDPGPGTHILTNPVTSSLVRDVYFAKYSPDGELIFAHELNANFGEVTAMEINADGDILITGTFTGLADFDFGDGVAPLESMSNIRQDLFLAKYDTDGNYIWAFNLPIEAVGSFVKHGLATDEDKNIYLTGQFRGTVDFDLGDGVNTLTANGESQQCFVVKYSDGGQLLWAFSLDAAEDSKGNDIVLDGEDCFYVTGSFSGSADFDPGPSTANLNAGGIFIGKYSLDGELIWAFDMNGEASWPRTEGAEIAIDEAGNIYLGGYHSTGIDIDPGPETLQLNDNNGLLAKYDSDGNLQWGFSLGGGTGINEINDLQVVDSDVFLVGSYSGVADFDPGPEEVILDAVQFNKIFAASYNTDGEYNWAFGLNGPEAAHGEEIHFSGLDHFYMTTRFLGTVDFDPTDEVFNLSSTQWGWDLSVAKYRLGPTSINPYPESLANFGVFPSPVSERLTIDINDDLLSAKLEIFNAVGERVWSEYVAKLPGHTVDVSTLTPGTYFVRLSTADGFKTTPFLKL